MGPPLAVLRAAMIASPQGDEGETALKQRIRSIKDQITILDDDIGRAKSELWGEEVGSDD
jgi:hypothetical protein